MPSDKSAGESAGSNVQPNLEQLVWHVVSDETRGLTKQGLLYGLTSEVDVGVRHKICDTISEVANNTPIANWPELLPALSDCARSQNADMRASAYRVFASVPELLAIQPADQVVIAFNGAFQDSSAAVRLASLQAAVHYLLAASGNAGGSGVAAPPVQLMQIVPHMLSVLKLLLQEQNETGLVEAFSSLIELAEDYPKYFRNVLAGLVEFCTAVAKDDMLENSTRQTSLELLVTLAEVAPGMVRRLPAFCESAVPVSLKMLSELRDDEDDQEWYNTDTLEVDDNDENYVFGEQVMDRLACSIGGKQLLPVAFKYIPGMLASANWKERHAALMAVSAIGEGCYKVMRNELKNVLDMILPFFDDPHPRVRYATCNVIGQMSTDFQPAIQQRFHEVILTKLIPTMDSDNYPRVQAHAAAAMVNFSEEASKAVIEPYLNDLFERLLRLLNSNKRYVQEQAITTIATVADSAQDRFREYYSRIMPLLLNVLENAKEREHRLLRGKTIECATFVALAVGKETFSADVGRFVSIMQSIQQSVTEPDDPQASYLLAAWARLCKILGDDFIPLMPVVMPPLLRSAALQPDFAVLDADEDAEAQYSAEDGWEFASIGGQQIGIKTSILEEKCVAVEMLICYARELPAGFAPYAKQVLDLALTLLKFYFHDGVRSAAATAIPAVLSAIKSVADSSNTQLMAELKSYWDVSFQKFLSVIASEADDAYTMQLFNSLAEAIEAMGPGSLSAEQLDRFTQTITAQMTKYMDRMKERRALRANGQLCDEDDEEALIEDEAVEGATIDEVSKALHAIFKTHGESYLPYFDKFLPIVLSFLNDSAASGDHASRQWALCVFDDLIEFTGPASSAYAPQFFDTMIRSIVDPNSHEIRQAAAYGIGVAAQFGGEMYADAVAAAVPNLVSVIKSEDARSDDNVYATENAVAALAKILKFNSAKVPEPHQVLREWFYALPILYEEDEAPFVYSYLLEILGSNAQALLSLEPPGGYAGCKNGLEKCVNALTEALATELLPQILNNSIVSSLKGLMANVSEAEQASLWQTIPIETQRILKTKGYF
ncbi:importin subunit beta-3 [Spiromyces aspiralis]|uniref:Importin subunit beta-3 n=1 Tax=Spiromyces aspiralis TaxID=68401 RepID=A0ACC1HIH4_9FUNG|nr:importin subunit beta-3 [Spiromyces aspiralis]